jgi:hypothetical protein
MKKFAQKVQEIGNKAAQIKAAIESVPPRMAEVREAVRASTAQFQQLRSDVQSTVTHLRADNEEHLVGALREIDGSAEVFLEAGYDLDDVEMELGMPQRLIVHLEKLEDVSYATLRSLIAANEARQTTHGILSALLKAKELADRVNLANLTYHKLMVYVGPLPTVRLCWHAEGDEVIATLPAAPAQSPPPLASTAPSSSFFGSGSFFEQRTPVPTPSTQATPTVTAIVVEQAVGPHSMPESEAKTEREDPLARFKKMPDLSKHRR